MLNEEERFLSSENERKNHIQIHHLILNAISFGYMYIYVRTFGCNFNRDKTRANVVARLIKCYDCFSAHLVERHGKPFK